MSQNSLTTPKRNSNRKLLILFLIAIAIALLPWFVLAQTAVIKKETFNFDKASENDIGYNQAVKSGNTIYISGTVAEGPMDKAVQSVYSDIEKTLKHYNATFQNVVMETVFTTDLEAFKKNSALRKTFYNNDFPAASWIQIERLFTSSLVLEIQIVAKVE